MGNTPKKEEIDEKEKNDLIEENKRLQYRILHLTKNLKENLENETDKKKIEELDEENRRLQYRIKHLAFNLNEKLEETK